MEFMRAMNSETVDLIATDPPFNKGKDFHATPDSLASGASFQDRWSWEKDVHESWTDQIQDDWPDVWEVIDSSRRSWGDDMGAYLCFMGVRLIAMYRLLKPTGSIYLHCDPTASHYLKLLMDAIFGRKNFINEIVWQRNSNKGKGSQHSPRTLGTDTDSIFHYAKSKGYKFNGVFEHLSAQDLAEKFPLDDGDGKGRYNTGTPLFRQPSMGARPNLCYTYNGVTNPHPTGWRVSKSVLKKMDERGEIVWRKGKRPLRKSYASDYKGKPLNNLWLNIPIASGNERYGFATQKPLALYERLLKASSNGGDMVLDPFAGCATTLVACERLKEKRQWVGIDIWDKAQDAVVDRLEKEGLYDAKYKKKTKKLRQKSLFEEDMHFTSNLPVRTDDEEVAVTALPTLKRALLAKWQRLSNAEIREELEDAQLDDDGEWIICAGCGRELEGEFMELDHITPRSGRGANDISNRILLCSHCNRKKSNTLTLDGLRKENRKSDWMVDEGAAKAAERRAHNRYVEVSTRDT